VRAQGLDLRTAVVVGAGKDANRIVHTFDRNRWAGIDVRGWFDTPVDTGQLKIVPHLGGLDALASYVETHQINQVWIALPMSAQERSTPSSRRSIIPPPTSSSSPTCSACSCSTTPSTRWRACR
jgi:putative colanic acid biosynthesis UDP-glucose lipid carrier transferase